MKFKMPNRVYDVLKIIFLIATPLVSFVTAMSEVWGFPYGAEIAATISGIGVLAGAVLTKSSADYRKDGEQDD